MIRSSLAIILLVSAAWSKPPEPPPDKPVQGKDKKAEFSADGKKLVEKVRTRKGTNDDWKAGREFPLMFARPVTKGGKKQ